VIAVVEVINKKSDAGFSPRDEEVLAAICSHVLLAALVSSSSSFFFDYALR